MGPHPGDIIAAAKTAWDAAKAAWDPAAVPPKLPSNDMRWLDRYVRIRPGTNIAFNNGILNAIIAWMSDKKGSGGYDGAMGYGSVPETIDIVLVSHDHPDHNFVQGLQGNPRVVKGPGIHTASGIAFKGIPTYHDTTKGGERGENVIFCFTVDDVRLCHLGDLGHALDAKAASAIGTVDVLMMPVGGFYTIDAAAATNVMNTLKPRLVIPMHFKTFPILVQDASGFIDLVGKEAPGVEIVSLNPGEEYLYSK